MRVTTESFDTQRRTYEGEAPEIQVLVDHLLATGQIIVAQTERRDGTTSTQYLPSGCQGGWPQCLTCTCNDLV